MGGALKFLSLATALLSPVVRALDVSEAPIVPGAYIVEFADTSVSGHEIYCVLSEADIHTGFAIHSLQ